MDNFKISVGTEPQHIFQQNNKIWTSSKLLKILDEKPKLKDERDAMV